MKSYSIPVVLFISIILTAMLQMSVFSRLMLLHGCADIVLLTLIAWSLQEDRPNMWPWTLLAGAVVSFASALPFFTPLFGYIFVTGTARLIQRRIWQSPLLAMLLVTLVGTLMFHMLSMAALFANGSSIQFGEAWSQVTLPSLLINLLLAIPVYATVRSIWDSITPIYQHS
jgi:cell shape-determining protein MreD